MKARKRQTAVKGRFSAMMISAAVHVAVLIAAGTFVAVTVVQRQEARFEGRQVSRPKMQLQRLQVPQRARMESQAPQMSQRVTAQAVTTRSVDFQMPEIAGLGGGINVDMSGAGFTGSLGFATPQLNLFGLRSQGEKVVFILDTTRSMLTDEIGGIPAYTIVKEELTGLVSQLPQTTLFNVILFDASQARAFSKKLRSASQEAVNDLKNWLEPLNDHQSRIGFSTLTQDSFPVTFEPLAPIANTQRGWIAGLSYAIQEGVDVVYWLGTDDSLSWIHRDLYVEAKRGNPIDPISGQPRMDIGMDFDAYPGGRQRWNELVREANRLHNQENERRRASGQPDRIVRGCLVRAYIPSAPVPRSIDVSQVRYNYTSQDLVEYVESMLAKYRMKHPDLRRMGRRNSRFSLNVIHFIPVSAESRRLSVLADASRRLNGTYLQMDGLPAIRSATVYGQ